jgi:hypothetical protein
MATEIDSLDPIPARLLVRAAGHGFCVFAHNDQEIVCASLAAE